MRPSLFAVVGVLALLLLASGAAHAERTYTPAQLRTMVNGGNPPKQGKPMTKSQPMDYADCIVQLADLVASVRPNYPTRTIASTNVMRMEKIWTNDAAMTVTCSAPDKKMVITASKYL